MPERLAVASGGRKHTSVKTITANLQPLWLHLVAIWNLLPSKLRHQTQFFLTAGSWTCTDSIWRQVNVLIGIGKVKYGVPISHDHTFDSLHPVPLCFAAALCSDRNTLEEDACNYRKLLHTSLTALAQCPPSTAFFSFFLSLRHKSTNLSFQVCSSNKKKRVLLAVKWNLMKWLISKHGCNRSQMWNGSKFSERRN